MARAGPTSRASRWVPPPPGMMPRRISGWPSSGLVARDAEVAGQGQLAAAAQGEAGDGRDGGAGDVGHRVERPEEELADQLGLGAGDHLVRAPRWTELGDLGAGGEDAIAAGDDHGARRVVAQALGRRPPARAARAVDSALTLGLSRRMTATPSARRSTCTRTRGMGGDARPVHPSEPLGRPTRGRRRRVDHRGHQLVEPRRPGGQRPLVEQRGDDARRARRPCGRPGAGSSSPVDSGGRRWSPMASQSSSTPSPVVAVVATPAGASPSVAVRSSIARGRGGSRRRRAGRPC